MTGEKGAVKKSALKEDKEFIFYIFVLTKIHKSYYILLKNLQALSFHTKMLV